MGFPGLDQYAASSLIGSPERRKAGRKARVFRQEHASEGERGVAGAQRDRRFVHVPES